MIIKLIEAIKNNKWKTVAAIVISTILAYYKIEL